MLLSLPPGCNTNHHWLTTDSILTWEVITSLRLRGKLIELTYYIQVRRSCGVILAARKFGSRRITELVTVKYASMKWQLVGHIARWRKTVN